MQSWHMDGYLPGQCSKTDVVRRAYTRKIEHHISLLQPVDPSVVAFPLPSFDPPQEFIANSRVKYDTTLRV